MKLVSYILLVGLPAILASCDRSDRGGEPGTVPIAFSNAQTEFTKVPYPDGESFGVLAYYNGSDTPNFMYNQPVTNTGGVFSYSPIKYWPASTDSKISFYAYHPYNGAGITLNGNASTKKTLFFKLPTTADVDLMSASLENKSVGDGSMRFTFRHVLTQLSFTARNSSKSFAITLNTVKLVNVQSDVELLLNKDNGQNLSGVGGNPVTIPIITNESINIPKDGSISIDHNGQFRYVIPQNMTNLAIEITYVANGVSISKVVPLNTTAPWKSAEAVHYTLTFDPVIVTSQPVAWTDVKTSGNIGFSTTIMEYGVAPYGSNTSGMSGAEKTTYNKLKGEGEITNGKYRLDPKSAYDNEKPYYKLEIDKSDVNTGVTWGKLRAITTMDGDICKKKRGINWRMPRLSELKMMSLNRAALELSDDFIPFNAIQYWSGTENSQINAWEVAMQNGSAAAKLKGFSSNKVRCVKELP